MRSPWTRTANLILIGILVQRGSSSIPEDDRIESHHVRSRRLPFQNIASVRQGVVEGCRCEYPGEKFYDEDILRGSYVTNGETTILPRDDPACLNLWFLCPGVDFFDATPWSHDCPSNEEVGFRRRTEVATQQSRNSSSQSETRQKDQNSRGSNRLVDNIKHFFTTLPADNEFCVNGGTSIRSGEIPKGNCASRTLSFDKAGNRRSLPPATSVSKEWFPTLGVTITASSDGGPNNMHPAVFNMAKPDANGVDAYKASQLGRHVEMGNVLIPFRKKGLEGPEDDFGMLNFDFNEQTYVNHITLLNANDFSRIFIIQADGSRSIIKVESAGLGGIRKVDIDLESVTKMTIVFKSFAAVASIDLCVKRIHA